LPPRLANPSLWSAVAGFILLARMTTPNVDTRIGSTLSWPTAMTMTRWIWPIMASIGTATTTRGCTAGRAGVFPPAADGRRPDKGFTRADGVAQRASVRPAHAIGVFFTTQDQS